MIPNKIKVGLYIHISCLIERLVIHDKEKEGYTGSDKRNIRRFVKVFQDCFSEVKNYYNIEFPMKEIEYLYSIIQSYISETREQC